MAGFLDLPLEIRLGIYRLLPKEKRPPIPDTNLTKSDIWIIRSVDILQLALLLINKQISSEAQIVFYEENMWQFNLDLNSIHNNPTPFRTAYERLPSTPWFPHLRHIQIRYHLNCPVRSLSAHVSASQPLIEKMFSVLGQATALRTIYGDWDDPHLLSRTSITAAECCNPVTRKAMYDTWNALLGSLFDAAFRS